MEALTLAMVGTWALNCVYLTMCFVSAVAIGFAGLAVLFWLGYFIGLHEEQPFYLKGKQ